MVAARNMATNFYFVIAAFTVVGENSNNGSKGLSAEAGTVTKRVAGKRSGVCVVRV